MRVPAAATPVLATTALAALGLILLTTTQPWLRTVTELAAGTLRTRGTLTGADLVPWLPGAALVAGLAVVAMVVRARWARAVAVPATVAVLVGAARAAARAADGGVPGDVALSATTTPWLWLTVVLAAVASLCVGLLVLPRTPRRSRPRAERDTSPRWEQERRRSAADWRALTDGQDPTDV